ncbi:MAG: hypothetical protein ACJ8H8_14180 [Geminicoccaceae bacterium]
MARRPGLSAVGASAVLLAMVPAASRAEVSPAIGTAFTGWIDVAGKQVALPEGAWTLVARGYSRAPQMSTDAYGAIETVILFRQGRQVVDAFVAASRNVVPIEDGWGTASECLGENVELPLIVNYDATGAHTFCGFLAAVRNVVTPDSPDAWRAAAIYGKAQDLVPARQWLMAGYRLSDRNDVLDVRYHFNPVLRGALRAKGDSEDLGLVDWLENMREPVRIGFYNGLAGLAPMPMPWSAAAAGPSPVLTAKLERLAALRQGGALDERQYQEQRALLEKARARSVSAPVSNETLSLMKTTAEAVTAAVPTYLGNFLVLQDANFAAQLLGIQTVVDFAHDFGIEWAWNSYGPQRLREAPTIELPTAGVLAD